MADKGVPPSPRRRATGQDALSPRAVQATVVLGHQSTLKGELQKAKDSPACLVVMRGPNTGKRMNLDKPEMVLGRDPTCELPVADASVSRKHARVTMVDGAVRLTDLGSANGTLLNDVAVPKNGTVDLRKEDRIAVGGVLLKYLPAGEMESLVYGSLSSMATSDPLTKVFNKGFFQRTLKAEVDSANEGDTALALLFLDLDHFKQINDTRGHDAGDFVLTELCALLRNTHMKREFTFARYGGEEFVVLCPGYSVAEAQPLAEAICEAVRSHAFVFEDAAIAVTLSVGVAELDDKVTTSAALLKAADQAVYAAKSAGRNRVVVHGKK